MKEYKRPVCRLRGLINRNGESLSDVLRNNIHLNFDLAINVFPDIWTRDELFEEINPETNDNPVEVTARRSWDLDEIELLLQKVKIFGSDDSAWRKIAAFFPNRKARSLNLKYREILRYCNEFEIT